MATTATYAKEVAELPVERGLFKHDKRWREYFTVHILDYCILGRC